MSDRPERSDDDAPVFEFAPRRRIANRKDDGPQNIGQLIMPTLAKLGLKTRARHLQIMGLWPEVLRLGPLHRAGEAPPPPAELPADQPVR